MSIEKDTTASIEQRVKEIILCQFSGELGVASAGEIKNDLNLVNDIGADSFDSVELAMAMEDEFNFEIPDGEIENMLTVQDMINYATEHAKQ